VPGSGKGGHFGQQLDAVLLLHVVGEIDDHRFHLLGISGYFAREIAGLRGKRGHDPEEDAGEHQGEHRKDGKDRTLAGRAPTPRRA